MTSNHPEPRAEKPGNANENEKPRIPSPGRGADPTQSPTPRVYPGQVASVRLGSAPAAYGQAIRQLREERGRSEEQLASMSNLSQRSICGIEEGEDDPSLATILRIAEALGVHLSQLALAAEQTTGARSN